MEYYIANYNGNTCGPFKEEELLANGLRPSTLVWRQGMSQWMAASSMPELATLFTTPPPPGSDEHTSALEREIKQAEQEIEQLRQSVEHLEQDNIANLVCPPLNTPDKTRYDFCCPTWIKEAVVLLACVVVHLLLGITGTTTFFYIFFDLAGLAMCITAIVIGSKINSLNNASFAQGTPSRVQADKLASTNGWLVSIAAIVGGIIILVQSGLDMFGEGIEAGVVYTILYLMVFATIWFHFFRPIKVDNYSLKTSPTLKANAKLKKLREADKRRWQRELRSLGVTKEDIGDWDDTDASSDWDDTDWDWDSGSDYDDDWGGGDSGGGGSTSEW